jgi:hypothetical protein
MRTSRPLRTSLAKAWAIRACFGAGTWKPASTIRSGRKIRSSKNRPSVMPDTTSTTRPSTSVDRPYSKAVPGWWASGAFARRSISSALVRSSPSTPCRSYASRTVAFRTREP